MALGPKTFGSLLATLYFPPFFSVDHDHLDHLPRQVVKEDFGFIGQPQKRGAVQPLGLSASSVTITKKPRKTAETKSDAKQKWIAQQQQVIFLKKICR